MEMLLCMNLDCFIILFKVYIVFLISLDTNYSCLGWNTPSFGESQGEPFFQNIQISILAVMDYAINFLGFKENDIILFGWSIGSLFKLIILVLNN